MTTNTKKKSIGRPETGRIIQPPRYSQESRDKLETIATRMKCSMAEALEAVIDRAKLAEFKPS